MLMLPGIHSYSMEDYQSDPCPEPSLSKGTLHTLLTKTPQHAYLRHPRLGNQPHEESSRLDYGTAAHSLLFEGGANIVIVDADDWRTKAAKESRDAARADGKIPILARQHEKASVMAGVARKYVRESILGNVLADGKAEQSVFWQEANPEDPLDTIWCRARPDFLSTDHSIILDYKTTEVTNPAAFCRAMPGLGYDLQEVFYKRGIESVTGVRPDFYFLVQETEAPYPCYLVQCAPSMQEVAASRMKRGMQLWWDCMHAQKWPGYASTVYHAEAPAWAVMEEESAS